MTLIKSISGIRGTVGGKVGEGLSPVDIVKFVSAFASFLKKRSSKEKISMVVGRDARVSGEMVNHLVVGSLMGMGVDVIDAGLSTTPTVEMAVILSNADGGIILTASHNPAQWNALKLVNAEGEFINNEEGKEVLSIAEAESMEFSPYQSLGAYQLRTDFVQKHIDEILKLKLVDVEAIKQANFSVAVDAINSTGGTVIPELLNALGVHTVHKICCTPNGFFEHNPEPLPAHLQGLCDLVVKEKADLGISVDPDVDRLALVCEDGSFFGEEYTLVAVADYILSQEKGNTVSNLSSTFALKDITLQHGGLYNAAAVGEVNVVQVMKATNAIIGGEGNGGVIYPELHYGRDALVGVALFLTLLAQKKCKVSELKKEYPLYFMSKNKLELKPEMDVDLLLAKVAAVYEKTNKVHTIDGVKIEFEKEWVHLRKSNTEPIVRIYTESETQEKADALAHRFVQELS